MPLTTIPSSPLLATSDAPGAMPHYPLLLADILIAGATLTDASVTIQPGTDAVSVYTMPVATMTAPRVITVGVTGTLIAGVSTVWIVRRDLTANTLTIRNGGASGTSVTDVVIPASPGHAMACGLTYDGSDFVAHTAVWLR